MGLQNPSSQSHGHVGSLSRPSVSLDQSHPKAPICRARTFAPKFKRQSHQKSRLGCFSCKTRRIKCGEEKPVCENCADAARARVCVYPSEDPSTERLSDIQAPSATPASTREFNLQDMQFFYHFINAAVPPLPLGSTAVWVHEIPQFAQEHPYLMHALLALGASHLGSVSPENSKYHKAALTHRIRAISGLKKAMPQARGVYGESDAILATCYALLYQSASIADGMADFITFVRGCMLAKTKFQEDGSKTAFDLTPDKHFQMVEHYVRRLPNVDSSLIQDGLEALDALQPHLLGPPEVQLYRALRGVLTGLHNSSEVGYVHFMLLYEIWKGEETFKACLDPTNTAIQLLMSFYIAELIIMVPLSPLHWPEGPGSRRRLAGVLNWSHGIWRSTPSNLQPYLKWPRSIVTMAATEVTDLTDCGPPLHVNLRMKFL
jgi:Fungal specific transcription factor domain